MFFRVAGSNPGTSPLFNITASTPAPVRKIGADDFLNSENDKNDYDWYVLCRYLSVCLFFHIICIALVLLLLWSEYVSLFPGLSQQREKRKFKRHLVICFNILVKI